MRGFCFMLLALTSWACAFGSPDFLKGQLDRIEIFQKAEIVTYNIYWMDKKILENSSAGIEGDDVFFLTLLKPYRFSDHTKWLSDEERKERERWVTVIAVHESQQDKVFLQLKSLSGSKVYAKELLENYPTEKIELGGAASR